MFSHKFTAQRAMTLGSRRQLYNKLRIKSIKDDDANQAQPLFFSRK